jgi:hypothetical protein
VPTDADGSDEQADIMAGMIRAIQQWSKADDLVWKPCTRVMVETGFAAGEVTQEWADADVFEQDLFIRQIPNAVDRVWVDQGSVNPDWSDANHVHVMQTLTPDACKRKFPDLDRDCVSVDTDRYSSTSHNKPEVVTLGRIVYLKPVKKELVQMSDGRVLAVDDDYERIRDELADVGIEEKRRRTRDTFKVFSRIYDGSDWLTPEQETVFSKINIFPMYGNHRVADSKVWWRGAVEKLMDAQRVYNYAESRNVEDTALAPKEKIVATLDQIAGNPGWSSLNTNADPALVYTHVNGQPQPYKIGGPQPNQGILTISESMRRNITQSAGLFAANMGDNPGLQSGVAIERLQDVGNSGSDKYINARRITGNRVFEVAMNAIPVVYDTKRSTFILGEDGKGEIKTINDNTVIDNETGEPVVVNDLAKGHYQVTCKAGKSFTSRQAEGSAAIIEMGQVKPDILDTGLDIVLKGMSFPGSEEMAERARVQLLNAGAIPVDQMSEEEQAQAQARAEAAAQQPDPAQELVQVEAQKVAVTQQNNTEKNQIAAAKVENERLKLVQGAQTEQANLQLQAQGQASEQQMAVLEAFNLMANTLKTLREAMGVDAIVGPGNQEAYIRQANEITEAQDQAGFPDINELANRDIG